MNELTYLQAAVLGAVQGLTEFLPISSSGHLALVQDWFGLDPASPPILLFDMMSHVGTTIAMLAVFIRPLRVYLSELIGRRSEHQTLAVSGGTSGQTAAGSSHSHSHSALSLGGGRVGRRRSASTNVAWRVTWLAIVATAVTGVIGMTFKTWFESTFADRDLLWVGFMVTGVALAVTPLLRRGRRGWRQVGWHHAAWIGLAQAISILPSISRSGATICAALFCGIRRRWAAEFSFLIAVPAILGATLIKLKDSFEVMGEGVALPWGAILFGSVVAGVVGLFALLALLHILRLSKLHYFAPYCWVIGALILLRVL